MLTATLEALASFPDQLDAYYSAFPVEYRHWAPASWDGVPSEPFTAIEQLCHVRDIEVEGYQVRIRRTLAEENPLLVSLDSERLAHERDYAGADATAVLADLRLARSQTLALITSITPEQLLRPAHFEGYGDLTLHSLVHYLCSHDQQHLAGLQWLLGKIVTEVHA